MGKRFDSIDERLQQFIEKQPVFFVATAPLESDGHLNLSPRGLDSLRVIDPKTVAFVDLTGSGIETIAHIKQNQRIVLMVCAFEGPPKIVRLHGRGEVIEPSNPEFATLVEKFPTYEGVRAVIRISCQRISDSCGFGVPLMEYQGQRTLMGDWADRKGVDGVLDYQQEKNVTSIDGLPGLVRRDGETE